MPFPSRRLKLILAILGGGILFTLIAIFGDEVRDHVRFAGSAHVPDLPADFGQLPDLLPGDGASMAHVYRGLPHPMWQKDLFVSELWWSANRSIHGYRFYAEPIQLEAESRARLTALLSDPKTYAPYGGPKLCGGYHADFAAQVDDAAGRSYWYLVCFGCHEVLCFSENAELIADLAPAAYQALKLLWKQNTR